eukprot:scaffold20932_cov23-Tisochrysis_lutea.AAC.3
MGTCRQPQHWHCQRGVPTVQGHLQLHHPWDTPVSVDVSDIAPMKLRSLKTTVRIIVIIIIIIIIIIKCHFPQYACGCVSCPGSATQRRQTGSARHMESLSAPTLRSRSYIPRSHSCQCPVHDCRCQLPWQCATAPTKTPARRTT